MSTYNARKDKVYYSGCLLGGAIGDALGSLVDSLNYQEIQEKYGPQGLTELYAEKGKALISDVTQLTLFTAEGLLRAETRKREKGTCYPPMVIYYAYLRWLHTQGYPQKELKMKIYDGYLIQQKELHEKRSPGKTCLTALLGGKFGRIDERINDSKGCGGVMRVAPVGLYASRKNAFELGCECAALTHGNPSGYLSAGVLAHIIAGIIEGLELKEAIFDALEVLVDYQGYEECNRSVRKAIKLAKSEEELQQAIKLIGEGRVAEEALAIAVYCSLKYSKDFKKALCAAVNHDGGSKIPAALTGNILGAYLGIKAIPADWVEKIELRRVIMQIADDLFTGYKGNIDWWNRYPGY